MINGFYVLALAIVIVGGFLMLGKATQHDARLQPVEPIDYDALSEEEDTRFEDDADAWRKGER